MDNWYLIWFGLNNEELVFYLLKENSVDFNQIQSIIPSFQSGGRIENTDSNFSTVLRFLENKIENCSIQFLQDLEIIAQTDEVPSKIIKPRFFDIEKAKKAYCYECKHNIWSRCYATSQSAKRTRVAESAEPLQHLQPRQSQSSHAAMHALGWHACGRNCCTTHMRCAGC